ncbi:MAG TPA: inner-membrane translocator [Ktedonobacterales bacterium]|nr:inner-membrane translocator [Ktedonobacterales bacterium]
MSEETKTGHDPTAAAVVSATGAVASPMPPASPASERFSLGQFIRGDLGALPVLIALIVIAIFFQVATKGLFLSAVNLSNLAGQIITIGVVSLGAVLVLLIGEIDLSLAAVATFCGAIMGILAQRHGWPAIPAILGGLAAGLIIGFANGIFVAVLRMPSFIVTLAGLIAYQGAVSQILNPQTTLPISNNTIDAIAVTNLPDYLGIGLPILALVVYMASVIVDYVARQRRHLAVKPVGQIAVQLVIATVVVIAAVVLFESPASGGVPLTTVVLVGLIIVFWLILTRTAFGRHVYAVGGNVEAARRAGIRVVGLKIALFTLCSGLAALAGILEASREFSAPAQVDQTLLLNAIAGAVVGGVSLFGGRGSVWAVVLGSLIVGSLINGLALLNQPIAVEEMVEGAVLLLAVLADALLRRRSQTGYR